MNNSKISTLSKAILLLVMGLLVSSIFVPMWRIELSAPQYPEGLVLQLHANKIGGDVDIINGLNHYIGMKTLHKEDFIEFTVLPYIIGFFAFCALAVAIIAKKNGLYALFISFILFGILAGVDFYRWNYEYGHNLDPNAAIRVPGMSYQPPLIGYKQLLNFGAYSIPDIGGWMLIASGFLLFFLVVKADDLLKTEKGRVYKFDDFMCMTNYGKENSNTKIAAYYVNDYSQDNVLIPAKTAFFLSGGTIQSPMRGGIIALSTEKDAKEFGAKLEAEPIT